MAMKYHPDRGGDEKKFKEISQAYEFLSDPQKKQIIDLGGDPNAQPGMGDDSIPGLRSGDLLVNVIVREHPRYKREGTSLIIDREVNVWDALLGASIEIQTLDRKTLSMSLPPGTQPDTVMSCKGEGLPNMRTRQRGNLLIRIKVVVPKIVNPEQINLIQQIKQGTSND